MVSVPMPGQRRNYPVVPGGQQRLVIADVVDKGEIATQWGPKPKVDFICFSEHEVDGERPSLVARFTNSLDPKAKLRAFLQNVRGHDILPSEGGPGGFDLDVLIVTTFYANVVQKRVGQRLYANISTAMPLPPGMEPLTIPENYVRFKDRQAKPVSDEDRADPDDDGVPF